MTGAWVGLCRGSRRSVEEVGDLHRDIFFGKNVGIERDREVITRYKRKHRKETHIFLGSLKGTNTEICVRRKEVRFEEASLPVDGGELVPCINQLRPAYKSVARQSASRQRPMSV
jgi:hypothetical protein